MFKDFEKYCPKAVKYLNKVGKKNPSDEEEMPKHEKVFACSDGGFRWGIMTTNGSESLNNVFRQSRKLPVAAIVEDTFYKCNAWFVKRREQAAYAGHVKISGEPHSGSQFFTLGRGRDTGNRVQDQCSNSSIGPAISFFAAKHA